MFEFVIDLAFETPKIYDIYAYVLFIFIENNIMKVDNLKNIFRKEMNKSDMLIISKIYKNIYDFNKDDLLRKELKGFEFVYKNKDLFEWVFSDNAKCDM